MPLYFDSENDWLFNTGVLERLLCEQPVLFGDRKGVLVSERSDAASERRHPLFTGKA